MTDSRAFVRLLRAQLALDDGEVAFARQLCEAARAESSHGSPPPQFMAALNWVDALVTAAESGPERGLEKVVRVLEEAVTGRCAEVVTAGFVDDAARLLAELGDHARAACLLATGTRWRDGHPRPMPQRSQVERTETATRAVLGPRRYESEAALGTQFTADDALHELNEALREHAAE